MNTDLSKSQNAGVRWQAQMEEHLLNVRQMSHEGMLPGLDPTQALLRASFAQAHAQAALALAVANGLGDIEVGLARIADGIGSL